jgi:SET domain-containing protein
MIAMKDCLPRPEVEVRKSLVSGNGVFALKNFKKNDLIEACPVLMVKKGLESITNYVFRAEGNDYNVLPLGYGCIYNHAALPNAKWEYDEGNLLLIFKAQKNIFKGEEIFVYYSPTWFADRNIELQAPSSTSKRFYTIAQRIGLILLLFGIVKMALWEPPTKPIKLETPLPSAKIQLPPLTKL